MKSMYNSRTVHSMRAPRTGRDLAYRICGLALFVCALVLAPDQGRATGVENKEITINAKNLVVSLQYPVLGVASIDADIQDWAAHTADSFQAEVSEVAAEQACEMKGTYRLVRATENIVSIIWDVWNFTGGAHGNLDIVTFVYDLRAGRALDLQDLFADEEGALNLLSRLSGEKLKESLGDMADEAMIKNGTTPDLDNFACVVPTPEGVRVYFQPYQVAPWAAGPQEVNISLADLKDAEPEPKYWGEAAR